MYSTLSLGSSQQGLQLATPELLVIILAATCNADEDATKGTLCTKTMWTFLENQDVPV